MIEFSNIPISGTAGTNGQANVFDGVVLGSMKSIVADKIMNTPHVIEIRRGQSLENANEKMMEQTLKVTTSNTGFAPFSLTLGEEDSSDRLRIRLRISREVLLISPNDLATLAASLSLTIGDLQPIGMLSLLLFELCIMSGRILKRITPALTNVKTCNVPREIALAKASNSIKHATKAVITPVMIVPIVGTPVFGLTLANILHRRPS
mmetsp:Transcript_22940/g.26160  ORF Transcript_22940/g.26160 Transcript_22940/m.26160 type:complete len:207 (-) Transcript_22940:371-991(-)